MFFPIQLVDKNFITASVIFSTRMKYVVIVILSCLLPLASVGQVTFQKLIGGQNGQFGYSIQTTSDNGCIVAGMNASIGAGFADGYLVKFNEVGDTLWTKTYGGWQNDHFNSIQQTSDHGFIMAGVTESFGVGSTDFYIVRTDSVGNLLWSKVIGGNGIDIAQCVNISSDGGFIVAGATSSFGSANGDIYIVKFNSIGDTLWTKVIGTTAAEGVFSICKSINGGFMVTGHTSSSSAGIADLLMMQLDSIGNIQWQKVYGTTGSDVGYLIEQTDDGGYIVTGQNGNGSNLETNLLLMKTDSVGNIEWKTSLKSRIRNEGRSVRQTLDGGYVCTGYLIDQLQNISELFIAKFNSFGDTLWTRRYSMNIQDENGYSIDLTNDSSFILTGISLTDMYIIKTDSLGYSGCNLSYYPTIIDTVSFITSSFNPIVGTGGIVTTPATQVGSGGIVIPLCSNVSVEELNNENEISISPNPFDDFIQIQSSTDLTGAELIMYDVLGKEVFRSNINREKQVQIPRNNINTGMYFFKIVKDNRVLKTGKLVAG